MLRLCRSDNLGVRDLVPPLLIRLNRDQECYDFIKWWLTKAQDSNYAPGDLSLGFLDVQDANSFEPITGLVSEFSELSMLNALALLKVKLLLSLLSLKNSASTLRSPLIPREIFDIIRPHIQRSPVISQNTALLEHDDHTAQIHELEDQVRQLYALIHKRNPYCWGVLLYPGGLS